MRINIRNVFDEKPKQLKEIVEGKQPEPVPEPQQQGELETEIIEEQEIIEEPEEESENDEPELFMEGSGFWSKYGSLFAIGASFAVLIAALFIHNNLVPREVIATIDGEKSGIVTKKHTVAGFLDEQGIVYYEADYLSTPPEGFIHDGMKFKLIHATDFQVTADGRTTKFKSLEKTVGEALADVGIKVRKKDIVTPAAETSLTDELEVVVQRVTVKKVTVKEKVAFKTINQDDTTMNEGETKVITEGKNGRHKVTYEVTYVDGKEAARKELSREVLIPVVDKVVAHGTRINYNGKSYSRKLVVKAYSYTGGGRTAMGTRARVGEIAVDPSVIPLGTNVYIEGIGARRAEDTGGNIKGNTIDIYMATHAECIRWGVRYVTIYIE